MTDSHTMMTVTRRDQAIDGGMIALAVAGAVILLWQGSQYIGLVERLGEWQFAKVDRYWPTLTPTLIVLLALIVMGLIMMLRHRYRARRGASAVTPLEQYQRVLIGETRLLRIAAMLTAIGAVGALFCVLSVFTISDVGPVREVDVRAAATPLEGPARLLGRIDMAHIAILSHHVLFVRQDLPLAPVASSTGIVRYLVELERVPTRLEQYSAPHTGSLRRFPAARELAPLYRSVGITLGDNPYVLLRSAETLRWTWKAAAAQSAVFALVAGCFAGIFRHRRKRLTKCLHTDEEVAQSAEEPSPPR